jgi:hypothetical protein
MKAHKFVILTEDFPGWHPGKDDTKASLRMIAHETNKEARY